MKNQLTNILAFVAIFTAIGVTAVCWFFSNPSPKFNLLILTTSVAFSISSTMSWLVVCRTQKYITGVRSLMIGCLSGLAVVPMFWFSSELIVNGKVIGPTEILSASIFFCVLFIGTVPLGITAAFLVFICTRKKPPAFDGTLTKNTDARHDHLSDNAYRPPRN